jgi:hypothetical protein
MYDKMQRLPMESNLWPSNTDQDNYIELTKVWLLASPGLWDLMDTLETSGTLLEPSHSLVNLRLEQASLHLLPPPTL